MKSTKSRMGTSPLAGIGLLSPTQPAESASPESPAKLEEKVVPAVKGKKTEVPVKKDKADTGVKATAEVKSAAEVKGAADVKVFKTAAGQAKPKGQGNGQSKVQHRGKGEEKGVAAEPGHADFGYDETIKWPLLEMSEPYLIPVPMVSGKANLMQTVSLRLGLDLDHTVETHCRRLSVDKSKWFREAIRRLLAEEQEILKKEAVEQR